MAQWLPCAVKLEKSTNFHCKGDSVFILSLTDCYVLRYAVFACFIAVCAEGKGRNEDQRITSHLNFEPSPAKSICFFPSLP